MANIRLVPVRDTSLRRTNVKRRFVVSLSVFLLFTGIHVSQTPPAAPQVTPKSIEVNVVQVPLVVTVTDLKGQLIATLKREDFRVFEDGRPQRVDAFSRETDVPLSIALLVDISSSTVDQLGFEKEAASDFFSKVVKRGKDRAMVAGFESRIRTMADFSDDSEKLTAGLSKLSAGGATALYDAVRETAEKKLALEEGGRRKVIIVISDGYDTNSRYSLSEALEMAQKRDVVIYAISTNRVPDTKNDHKDDGDKTLQQLVNETGGKVYFPKKLADLGAEFQKIEEELRSQYVLAYTPANPFNETYRKLRVETTDKKFKARTRNGYFASKK